MCQLFRAVRFYAAGRNVAVETTISSRHTPPTVRLDQT